MGGKKKLSIKQMEKMQSRQPESKKGESAKSAGTQPKAKSIGIFPPDPDNKKVIEELKKMKVLTPYSVASRLELRLSAAKQFLRELEQQGTIQFVSSSRNLKVYKIAD